MRIIMSVNSLSGFLICQDRYRELESDIASLEEAKETEESLNPVLCSHLIFECKQLQDRTWALVRSPDADEETYALQESIEKLYTRSIQLAGFSNERIESTGDSLIALHYLETLQSYNYRIHKPLFQGEKCLDFEIGKDGLIHLLMRDRIEFHTLETGEKRGEFPLPNEYVSKSFLFHISQDRLFLSLTVRTDVRTIHMFSLESGERLHTIDLSQKEDVKSMHCDENYLHVRMNKHWQIWDLTNPKWVQRLQKYDAFDCKTRTQPIGWKTEKKTASFFQSLLLGREGTFHFRGIEIQFADIKVASFEGAGVISAVANRCAQIPILRQLSLSPLHVLGHEMGHALAIEGFTGQKPKKITIATEALGGNTEYHFLCHVLPDWQRSAIDAAGPLLHAVLSSAQLATAVALKPYLPRPVTLLLEGGAMVQMAGELLYAYTSAVKRDDGDFGHIAQISTAHLAVATAGLVATCAIGIFGASQLGSFF